ncbi:DUF6907 domain-containing protein [Rugosimonospora acidiphila]
MTNELVHPGWCARNYRCTVSRLDGRHRSAAVCFPAADGRPTTVVSLSQRPTERTPVVEVRLRIRLSSRDESRQAEQIRQLLDRLNAAVREMTG